MWQRQGLGPVCGAAPDRGRTGVVSEHAVGSDVSIFGYSPGVPGPEGGAVLMLASLALPSLLHATMSDGSD